MGSKISEPGQTLVEGNKKMDFKEFKYDKLKVYVFQNRKEMGEFAAKEAAQYMREIGQVQEEINILFAAAPSQNDFLEALSREPEVPWHKVNAMQLDDYIGIDAGAPQRFANYLEAHIFSRVPVAKRFFINCENQNAKEELERYGKILKEHPADISFIGIGENGHIAFNDPGMADFCDERWIKAVDLDLLSRKQQVHDGCFGQLEEVPTQAMTVTVPPIMKAKRIFCMVPGSTKSKAVRNTLYEEIGNHVPSTVLRTHLNAALYLDEDGADLLS